MDSLGRTHIGLHELLALHGQMNELLAPGERAAPATLLAGLRQARLHGRSLEFDQVRTYQPGDDARHIDWRATARAGATQTRQFHRERDRPVYIMVEQGPAMFFASTGNFKSVQAALAASLFCWTAQSAHDRVGGLVFAEEPLASIPATRQQQGIIQLLQAVSRANRALTSPLTQQAGNPLQRALEYSHERLLPGSLVVLICAEQHLDAKSARLLSVLARTHECFLLPVSDPLEHRLPPHPALDFAGTSGRLRMAGRRKLQQQWSEQATGTRQAWQELAQERRATLLPLTTAHSIRQQMLGTGDC